MSSTPTDETAVANLPKLRGLESSVSLPSDATLASRLSARRQQNSQRRLSESSQRSQRSARLSDKGTPKGGDQQHPFHSRASTLSSEEATVATSCLDATLYTTPSPAQDAVHAGL